MPDLSSLRRRGFQPSAGAEPAAEIQKFFSSQLSSIRSPSSPAVACSSATESARCGSRQAEVSIWFLILAARRRQTSSPFGRPRSLHFGMPCEKHHAGARRVISEPKRLGGQLGISQSIGLRYFARYS